MRLEKEFIVGAPLERAWRALSDVGVLASCIPGAELRLADGVYIGRLEVTANGSRIQCEAAIRSIDQDEDEHVATILLQGRQLGGPGIGSATVQSRCERADSSTRVVLSAEVLSSGYEHPGEAFEGAAREVFDKAADLLKERAIASPPPVSSVPTPAQPLSGAATAGAPATGALPVPASAQKRLQRGLALAGGALVAVVVVRRLLGGRRSGLW